MEIKSKNHMKKLIPLLLLPLLIIFLVPVCSASLSEDMNTIGSYVSDYNSGKIDAAKLIVYIEYAKNKMYEALDREEKKAFTESVIITAFKKKEIEEGRKEYHWHEAQFERVFPTDDFDVVFTAHPFYRYDVEYYERREEEAEFYYTIGYHLRIIKGGKSQEEITAELKSFIAGLKAAVGQEDPGNLEELRKRFSKIKQQVWETDIDNCEQIMKDAGMIPYPQDEYMKEKSVKSFYVLIKEQKEKNCWPESKCDWVCEPEEFCHEECHEKEVCEENCISSHEEEICEEVCVNITSIINETNETVVEVNCTTECSMKEVCDEYGGACFTDFVCEEVCKAEERCYDKCEEIERCDEFVSGELKVEGACRKDEGDVHINAYGPGLDHYNMLNDMGEGGWNCDAEIEGLVMQRKAFQKSINNEFARWYFEEFMSQDYERIINGGNGFKRVLEIIKANEENIANNLHCSESKTWPEGFVRIDVTYINNNTHVEVWEKKIPVEWDPRTKYWTTLYKYSWIPDKELLKGLINYKASELDTLGVTAKDVAEIKADEGKMEIIEVLSKRYGGSFDVKLELKEEEGAVVMKYLQINPDVAIKFSDQIEEKPDISITVDYSILYDFISYMSYTMEGDRIQGPHWVRIGGEGGPGKIFSAIGAISRMWRKGVKIKPRYALLKMFFNVKNFVTLLGKASVAAAGVQEGQFVKIERPEMEMIGEG